MFCVRCMRWIARCGLEDARRMRGVSRGRHVLRVGRSMHRTVFEGVQQQVHERKNYCCTRTGRLRISSGVVPSSNPTADKHRLA